LTWHHRRYDITAELLDFVSIDGESWVHWVDDGGGHGAEPAGVFQANWRLA
jgi:hypothetical protein